MIKIFSGIFLGILVSISVSAAPHRLSAARAPQQDWKELTKKSVGPRLLDTPIDKARPLPNVDFNNVIKLTDYAAVEAAFQKTRDVRFLRDPEDANFMRRISWMYPDDGCFARSSLVIQKLEESDQKVFSKIFVFGNLSVQSSNALWGSVEWWYHVAPIVTDGTEKYVLDPAVDASRPLKLMEWIGRISPHDAVSLAVCKGHTYEPEDSSCDSPLETGDDIATMDQLYFLPDERQRLYDLGRDADKELGDFPPWLM